MVVQTYGIRRSKATPLNQNPASSGDSVASTVEQLHVLGFAVMENVLGRAEIDDLNARLDGVYRTQCDEVGGEEKLLAINDADIVRSPLAYDDAFLGLSTLSAIRDVACRFLGENIVLLMQNGIINRPDRLQFQTRWHRDLNYQHWVSSKPLAMSALVALEDFNAETGGTLFLPSSQKFAEFPSDELVVRSEHIARAQAGSIIFFDAMTYHRAGVNRSGMVRRAVNHVIGAPLLSPQADYPAMLARHPAPADPWLAAYLGYRWTPMTSVGEWRRQRIAALTGM